ncbi:MAG: hypothetical protein Kow0031_21130 [Anaerolineae bacterium]
MAKRTRRERKQETEKRLQSGALPVPPVEVEEEVAPTPAPVEAAPAPARKTIVDFAREYYYVYTDMRNVTIIAVIMFALMFGLGYLI